MVTIEVDQVIWRSHRPTKGALYFTTGATERFDDPAQQFGVMYASRSAKGARAETLLHGKLDGKLAELNYLTKELFTERHMAQLALSRPLHFIALAEGGHTRQRYLHDLKLDWSSTGFVTYAPSPYYVSYEHGFVWVYPDFIIAANFEENKSEKAAITRLQSDEIKEKLGIHAKRSTKITPVDLAAPAH